MRLLALVVLSGDLEVNRLGFGAMRITGKGLWGVQNLYNLAHRQSEAVLDYCTTHGIGFIPWFPPWLHAPPQRCQGRQRQILLRR